MMYHCLFELQYLNFYTVKKDIKEKYI